MADGSGDGSLSDSLDALEFPVNIAMRGQPPIREMDFLI